MSEEQKQDQQLATIAVGNKGLVLSNLNEMWRFSTVAVQSGMTPKGIDTPQKAMICIQAGAEVGLPPWASLRSIAVINGRPCLWGDAFMGVVESSPMCEWVREGINGDGEKAFAWCETKRRNRPHTTKFTFSVDDAKKAGLWGKAGPWQQYPKRMLQMRARAFCLRDAYADILSGMGMVEEIADYPDSPRSIEVTVSDPQPTANKADALADKIAGGDGIPDMPEEPAPEPQPEDVRLKCPKCGGNTAWSQTLTGEACPQCGTKGIPA